MKKTALSLILLLAAFISLSAQSSYKVFVGLMPEITREIQNNEEKIFSVNVLPLVAQLYLNAHNGVRISPLLNLDSDTKELSNVGGQLAFPIYFLAKRIDLAGGVYAAPVIGFSHNRRSEGKELTLAIEPGYSWIFPKGFTMNLGLQLGGTNFMGGKADAGWRNHAGMKFSLGYTFGLN